MEFILSDRLEHTVRVVLGDSNITITPFFNDGHTWIRDPITFATADLLGRIEAMIDTRDEEAFILLASGGSPAPEVVIGWMGATPFYDTVSFEVRGKDNGASLSLPLPALRQALGIGHGGDQPHP